MMDILSQIICTEFNKKREIESPPYPKGMAIRFLKKIDLDVEQGNRYLDLFIYGRLAYIGVYAKLSWSILPTEQVVYDEEFDEYYHKGEYTTGETPWCMIDYHSSCWRNGVYDIMHYAKESLIMIQGLSATWYKWQPPENDIVKLIESKDQQYFNYRQIVDQEFRFNKSR